MSLESPYNQGCNKQTQNSLVVFADVLGFLKNVEDAYADGFAIRLLNKFSQAIDASYLGLRGIAEDTFAEKACSSWVFKAFSDNIVIGCPIENDGEKEMSMILQRLAVFQLTMIQNGFFVRGGVAVGEHYMDSNIVFGNALIEAIKIEKETARDPRIVLGSSAVDNLRRHFSYYTRPESAWHYDMVLKDSDNQYFLNYLNVTRPHEPFENDVFGYSINEHKEMVEGKLKCFSNDPYIRSKYAWVAGYHDFFCDQCGLGASYKIDPELLAIKPQRIGLEELKIKIRNRSA